MDGAARFVFCLPLTAYCSLLFLARDALGIFTRKVLN